MSAAIKVENLSKAYQLGQIGTGTISRDIERWYAKLRGKEDPFLRIGEINDQNTKSESDIVWSLRDINFEIEQGDAVGIIGRNGAGKSTLLKILSRITSPTTGKISGKGRIASLLEVGTGFHPELSGRENIFLNGAILGMRKKEIVRKLDEIVDFAGIERYLDTPVKRYSSGMYVRLAFAVAAHLESEILIVDEVLAVGDAEFQKKCLGKMDEVSKGQGRTVLFVSHNMDAVMNLCKNGIVLNSGKSEFVGNIHDCIEYYQNSGLNSIDNWVTKKNLHRPHFTSIKYQISGTQPDLVLTISFKTSSASKNPAAFVVFGIKSSLGGTIMEAVPSLQPFIQFNGGETSYSCEIKLTGFIPGTYFIYAWLGASEAENYDWQDNILSFEVTLPPMAERTFPYSARTGFLVAQSKLI
ncbi:ATP-binding cassette domain-containing protein [Pedobacter polaris]|uniref:ATP-binding cassette domain-containing protein n=1 Tax=Pedobacter polaris TaxID=2571273 RepID=A0A4U1CRE9_9SPHI|nr:polysaccharide ABC transporter ATP-binding protein [Pedobacter polaris]TKC08191.1 ATP-binding cassette domain-containing protein [Pedobacter polaris]